jgi:hypothetical protein
MNFVGNLKWTQFTKLFKIFKSSFMQSLNIFGIREGICFVLQNFEEFEIYLEKFKLGRAQSSAPCAFRLCARCRSDRRHHYLLAPTIFPVALIPSRVAGRIRPTPFHTPLTLALPLSLFLLFKYNLM